MWEGEDQPLVEFWYGIPHMYILFEAFPEKYIFSTKIHNKKKYIF